MVDEIAEARERTKAAWSLIQADVVRLKEAFRIEIDHVRELGPTSFFKNHPLPIVGIAAGLGLIAGVRGGRRKAAYRAIVRAGSDVVATATQQMGASKPEKSLKRKLLEGLLLAVASKGAQTLAELAQSRVHAHLQQPPRPLEKIEETSSRHVVIPESARGSL